MIKAVKEVSLDFEVSLKRASCLPRIYTRIQFKIFQISKLKICDHKYLLMEEQTWTIIWREIGSEFKLMSVSYWLATRNTFI